ncbi:hypothetical protein ScPMuIL_012081 [Solemya velum]
MFKIVCLWILFLILETIECHNTEGLSLQQSDTNALNTFRLAKRRSYYDRRWQSCRRWNNSCAPWASEKRNRCCYNQGLACRCNLWMQNCKCVSKLWG